MNPNSPERDFIVKWHSKICKELPNLKNHSSVLYKSSIIIFGGYDGENNLNTVYIYDIEKDKCNLMKTSGDIPKGRNGHSATVVGNKYVF